MGSKKQFSLLIYSTHVDSCIYHREWQADPGTASKEDREKLLFGLLYSLRRTATKMSPKDRPGQMASLTTSGYKRHSYETVTGFQFVLLTPSGTPNLRERLRVFFSQVFLPLVVRNPLYELNTPIHLAAFDVAVDAFEWEKRTA
jgi:hypothetical protein